MGSGEWQRNRGGDWRRHQQRAIWLAKTSGGSDDDGRRSTKVVAVGIGTTTQGGREGNVIVGHAEMGAAHKITVGIERICQGVIAAQEE